MVANGCWPLAKDARVSLQTVGKRALPEANLLLPSISLRSPCLADTTESSILETLSHPLPENNQHPTAEAQGNSLHGPCGWFARLHAPLCGFCLRRQNFLIVINAIPQLDLVFAHLEPAISKVNFG